MKSAALNAAEHLRAMTFTITDKRTSFPGRCGRRSPPRVCNALLMPDGGAFRVRSELGLMLAP
jgi:hypothetical protein